MVTRKKLDVGDRAMLKSDIYSLMKEGKTSDEIKSTLKITDELYQEVRRDIIESSRERVIDEFELRLIDLIRKMEKSNLDGIKKCVERLEGEEKLTVQEMTTLITMINNLYGDTASIYMNSTKFYKMAKEEEEEEDEEEEDNDENKTDEEILEEDIKADDNATSVEE